MTNYNPNTPDNQGQSEAEKPKQQAGPGRKIKGDKELRATLEKWKGEPDPHAEAFQYAKEQLNLCSNPKTCSGRTCVQSRALLALRSDYKLLNAAHEALRVGSNEAIEKLQAENEALRVKLEVEMVTVEDFQQAMAERDAMNENWYEAETKLVRLREDAAEENQSLRAQTKPLPVDLAEIRERYKADIEHNHDPNRTFCLRIGVDVESMLLEIQSLRARVEAAEAGYAALVGAFQVAAYDAYCQALREGRYQETLLGAESKLKSGSFGRNELTAHRNNAMKFGKHFGIHEVLTTINKDHPGAALLAELEEQRARVLELEEIERDANILHGIEWRRSVQAVNGDPEAAREHRIARLVGDIEELKERAEHAETELQQLKQRWDEVERKAGEGEPQRDDFDLTSVELWKWKEFARAQAAARVVADQERDCYKWQLEEASKEYEAVQQERDRAVADNAAFKKLCERACAHLDGCSHGYPDELWDDLEAGWKDDHPGAAILAENAALRAVVERLPVAEVNKQDNNQYPYVLTMNGCMITQGHDDYDLIQLGRNINNALGNKEAIDAEGI